MNRKFATYAAGLMAGSFLATPVFAQDDAAADDADVFDDNVIIVTATKRAQDVQDIPLAVTAVSPAQLEQQGVVDVRSITQVSPSFSTSQAQNSSGTVVLRIRGVGTTSNNIGFESAVGVFIDGAYQSRAGIALGEFVDVERVEVLRGPQGTLFGRNTSAGALNITNSWCSQHYKQAPRSRRVRRLRECHLWQLRSHQPARRSQRAAVSGHSRIARYRCIS